MGVNGPGDAPDPDRPRTPRAPRPGDPFATAAGPAGPSPRPRRHRKGRTFFLLLLTAGAVLTVGTFVIVFSRPMTVDFYHDVVVPRGIPEALPPDYPRADAVRLVEALDTFFARADKGEIGDDRVIEMIAKIESSMADRLITPEEAEALIATAGRLGAPGPRQPAAPADPAGGEG